MNIVVLASAERGLRCLKSLTKVMSSDDELTVFTFPETEWEPKYVARIEDFSNSINASFHVTTKVHDEQYNAFWKNNVDIILVIGWRYLIPESVYNNAKLGCFVFHDSLLPEYRGFGPSVWSIRNGENHTGASLFKISKNIDDGPILDQVRVEIGPTEYIGDVVEKVTVCYEEMIAKNYKLLRSGDVFLKEQSHNQATYTCKNMPIDFEIDWNQSSADIYNLIRAYSSPYPGAFTTLNGKKLTILKASIVKIQNYIGIIPGRVLEFDINGNVTVLCGRGALKLERIIYESEEISPVKLVVSSIGDTLGK